MVSIEQLLEEYFPLRLRQVLESLGTERLNAVTEIRCRLAKPMQVSWGKGERHLFSQINIEQQEMDYLLLRLNQGSVYAWQEEYRRGYLTLPGGHRVGLVGKAVLEAGKVKTLHNISALNFRIAHAVYGAADKLLPYLIEEGEVLNTLLVAPPGCGKTTLLRDALRQFSEGVAALSLSPLTVGLVDERSEIAATVNGVAQLDVVRSTDVLDSCPKSEGMKMLIRSMNPDILACDEIGTREDVEAIEEALQAGVSVILTAHGRSIEEVYHHPHLSRLMQYKFIKRIAILESREYLGNVKQIYGVKDGDYIPLMR